MKRSINEENPEKRHLVVLLATKLWRYFWLDGNGKKSKRWLTRRSTFRKNDILSFYWQHSYGVTSGLTVMKKRVRGG